MTPETSHAGRADASRPPTAPPRTPARRRCATAAGAAPAPPRPPDGPAIGLRDLNAYYGDAHAIKDVTLDTRPTT